MDEVVGDFAAVEEAEESQTQEQPAQDSDSGEDDPGEDEVPQAQQLSDEDHSEEEEDNDASLIPRRTVEVVIPRDELEDDERAEYVDFTAGGDAVRRVLSEREDRDGMMEYTVEFEDYHVDEVRFACDFTSCNWLYIYLPSFAAYTFSLTPTSIIGQRHTDQCSSFSLKTYWNTVTGKKHSTTSNPNPRRIQSPKQRQRPNRDDQARGCLPRGLGHAHQGKLVL